MTDFTKDASNTSLILRVQFKHLRTLHIEIRNSSWTRESTSLVFEDFCLRHRSLNRLNVNIDDDGKIDQCSLMKFYTKLRFTTDIKTCNISQIEHTHEGMNLILIDSDISFYLYDNYHRAINWRQLKKTEVEIFGKNLNDDESSFFV